MQSDWTQPLATLKDVVARCETTGIKDYVLDPGIGIWTPLRSVDDDWTLCQHFAEFQRFDRPVLAAISRKTFIGDLLKPESRRSSRRKPCSDPDAAAERCIGCPDARCGTDA